MPWLRVAIISILLIAVVGVQTLKQKIHLGKRVGAVAGAHQLFGADGRAFTLDDGFATIGVGQFFSTGTVHFDSTEKVLLLFASSIFGKGPPHLRRPVCTIP